MANIVPFSFKGELVSGTHNFANGGDSFKIALYTSNPYSTSSTVALTTNEVSSAGSSNYVRKVLGSQAVVASTATFIYRFCRCNVGVSNNWSCNFHCSFCSDI
jgi:hypothetical protein